MAKLSKLRVIKTSGVFPVGDLRAASCFDEKHSSVADNLGKVCWQLSTGVLGLAYRGYLPLWIRTKI